VDCFAVGGGEGLRSAQPKLENRLGENGQWAEGGLYVKVSCTERPIL
jgi:hypothetical protein